MKENSPKLGRAPAMQLYVSDLLRDLGPLSDSARGLWVTMMCHMWNAPIRGCLIHGNCRPWTLTEILRISGDTHGYAKRNLAELCEGNVFSMVELPSNVRTLTEIEGHLMNELVLKNSEQILTGWKPTFVSFSRRMLREFITSKSRQVVANNAWEARKGSDFVMQKSTNTTTFASPRARGLSSSSSSESSETPDDDDDCKHATTTRANGFAAQPSPPETETREGLESELVGELGELLAELGELGHLDGTPSVATVAKLSKILAGRFSSLGEIEAIYPPLIAARMKVSPPRSWRWFVTVTQNAIQEGDL